MPGPMIDEVSYEGSVGQEGASVAKNANGSTCSRFSNPPVSGSKLREGDSNDHAVQKSMQLRYQLRPSHDDHQDQVSRDCQIEVGTFLLLVGATAVG